MPDTSVLTCIIDFSTTEWLSVVCGSYRTFFATSPVLLIDNNPLPNPDLSSIAQRFDLELLRNEGTQHGEDRYIDGPFGHGVGMDLALDYARRNGFEYLLHLEPDCLLLGDLWWKNFEKQLALGVSMVGSHRKIYGPIHPTPSVWKVADVTTSFRQGPRGQDILHPRFQELFDLPGLRQSTAELYAPAIQSWFDRNWDTAQRAWFLLAAEDRVAHVSQNDLLHLWSGSRRGPREICDERVTRYLERR